MRLMLFGLILFSAGSIVAAAYSPHSVENYLAYANVTSRNYAAGDSNDASGWRECTEMVNTPPEVGLVCEGVRTILVHGGKYVDVNYYCEFRFSRKSEFAKYDLEMEVCQ